MTPTEQTEAAPSPKPIVIDLTKATPAEVDAAFVDIHRALTTGDLASLARDLGTHYAGGDDGPIREPGDDVPSFGDVYGSPEQFAQQLDKDWNRLADLGIYDIAGDVQVAAQQISEMGEQIEVARDKVKELVDEIAALRYEIRRRNGGY